jgi:hypothetical protein
MKKRKVEVNRIKKKVNLEKKIKKAVKKRTKKNK